MVYWLGILLGFAALVGGADLLVRGASKIARGFGVPPIVIGLTLVAYGTSAPELATSTTAALRDSGAIAIGNVLGSNIFNIGIVLGLSALMRPVAVEHTLVKREVPLLVGISLLFPLFFLDGAMVRWEGALALAAGIAFTWWCLKTAKARKSEQAAPVKMTPWLWALNVGYVVAGIVALIFGADWLVEGAKVLAAKAGVTERIIGVTIVAAGTSLPELATSVVAALKKESDIALGNVIGSNIFNLLVILGAASLLKPLSTASSVPGLWYDCLGGIIMAALVLPFARTGMKINRWEGFIFIVLYIGYIFFLLT